MKDKCTRKINLRQFFPAYYMTLTSNTFRYSMHNVAGGRQKSVQNAVVDFWFATRQRSLSLPPVSSVNITGSTIPISTSIKTLGVTFDSHLTLNQHVSCVCKSSYFHLRALCHIRSVLTEDIAKQRIHFKIATLTYRALQSGTPSYLSSLINLNNPPRPLRSASLSLLHVSFTAKAVGRKAFRFAAPTIWNSIPQNIRLLPSIGSYKHSLNTHLFSHPG